MRRLLSYGASLVLLAAVFAIAAPAHAKRHSDSNSRYDRVITETIVIENGRVISRKRTVSRGERRPRAARAVATAEQVRTTKRRSLARSAVKSVDAKPRRRARAVASVPSGGARIPVFVPRRGDYGSGLRGVASYYWQPQPLASGGRFNPNAMTAAHRTLPFGTRVRVTRQDTGRSVVVTINDRGPYIAGRVIDLSRRAAQEIGMTGQGLARVAVDVIGR